MKLHQIITSLLDTDAYKFSMGQAIYHQYSDYKTTWTFKCRNTDVHFTHDMVEEIKDKCHASRTGRHRRMVESVAQEHVAIDIVGMFMGYLCKSQA